MYNRKRKKRKQIIEKKTMKGPGSSQQRSQARKTFTTNAHQKFKSCFHAQTTTERRENRTRRKKKKKKKKKKNQQTNKPKSNHTWFSITKTQNDNKARADLSNTNNFFPISGDRTIEFTETDVINQSVYVLHKRQR